MMMIEDQEHLDKVREFARSVGAEAELQKQLDFLAGFGGDPAKVRCHRPCCGGRMIIVEVFARGAAPRGPPSSDAGIAM
jgi:hypothetical protein